MRRPFFGWWIVFGASALSMFSGGVYWYGFSAFFLPLAGEFDASYASISLIYGLANTLQSAFLAPVMGIMTDRFGPRRITVLGVLMAGLGFVLLGFARHLVLVYLVFILLIGFGMAMGTGSPPAAAVANWFVRKRGRAFGLVNVGFGIGALLVVGVARLIDGVGWRDASIYIGVAVWAVCLPLAMLMRHRPEQYGARPDGIPETPETAGPPVVSTPRPGSGEIDFTLAEAVRTRAFWMLFGGFSLRTGVSLATVVHLIPALVDKSYTDAEAALLLGIFGAASIPFRLISGFLGDRFEKRLVVAVLVAAQGFAMLLLIWWVGAFWQAVITMAVFAVGSGGTASLLQPITGDYFGRRHYATIVGFGQIISVIGLAVFPFAAGVLRDAAGSYTGVFYTFFGVSAVAYLILLNTKAPEANPSTYRRRWPESPSRR